MEIPATQRDDTVETYHSVRVADPYRWLEDDGAPETQRWAQAQHNVTRTYLDTIPALERIKARYSALWNYPKYSAPHKEGERYYFSRNDGLQNQAVIYMQHSLNGEEMAILDPNTLSADGTVALTNQSFTKDGTLLAYGLSSSGSDWQEIKVHRVDEKSDYDEVIKWCKFSGIAWLHDNSGFYYNRLPEPGSVPVEDQNNYSQVYWHTLGTPQSADRLVFERPDAKELAFVPFITNDGKYLVLYVFHGTDRHNRIYYREATSEEPFIRLLDEADASYMPIGNDGPVFYVQTNLDAPRGRIVAIDTRQPERSHWRELVPQQEDVIDFALIVNEQFVLGCMHDAHHRIKLYHKDGSFVREIALPAPGSVTDLSGKPGDKELFLTFTSFLYPPTIFRYDFMARPEHALSLFHDSQIKFDTSSYETKQVFYTSKDGTQVPMFLTHKKGLALDGSNPVLLYGYGGFDISLTPSFGITPLVWIEMGGVYAVANLRGGGEYGEEWHKAGMLEKKQHVFDDAIAAAQWLIASGYTSPSRLAIMGGSNGGLLVGACLVQRPDLYGAVICRVPVIDMLRYHKFTVGHYWIPEYGDAEHNAEHFAFLYAYSPLHNVKAGTGYPPVLIMTADTDDRVVPAHARKFAATLQAANDGAGPILLRVETKAGHGLGKPTAKVIQEESDLLAFLCKTFAM